MNDNSKNITLNNEQSATQIFSSLSNPLTTQIDKSSLTLTDYSQSVSCSKYDEDIAQVLGIVKILNNMAPIRMPEYNFNLEEINGERYYRPDGTLLLVREYDSDVIRDYYVATPKDNSPYSISRILEHEKLSGRLKVKIEPNKRLGSRVKTNITIFDLKINNKYIIMQLSEGGIVNNITEFSGQGKSFQTLYRNIETYKPARYLEGKDDKKEGFEMVDCIFDANGGIARIKRFTNKKEVCIDYDGRKKNISVKNK